MDSKLCNYFYVLAALLTAQPLLNFISSIQVFYLQLFICTQKKLQITKLVELQINHILSERRSFFYSSMVEVFPYSGCLTARMCALFPVDELDNKYQFRIVSDLY